MAEKLKYFPLLPNKDEVGSERSDFVKEWVDTYLIPKGMATENEDEANAYLVASGDGGLTRAARNKCGMGKVIVGINCGTLGFLLNPIKEIKQIPVFMEDLNFVHVTLMQGKFIQKSGNEIIFLAFNDIFCGGNIADFIEFEIKGALSHFRNRKVKGNGIFVSTPQGTTGFALNARGSSAVLPLDTKTWFVGGVATGPYPNNVVSPQKITIEVHSRYPVHGYADGYEQEAKDIKKIIISPTKKDIALGFLKDIDFESRRNVLAQNAEIGG